MPAPMWLSTNRAPHKDKVKTQLAFPSSIHSVLSPTNIPQSPTQRLPTASVPVYVAAFLRQVQMSLCLRVSH